MRTLLLLIPFLTVPFFLPEVSAGVRMLAIALAGLSAISFWNPIFEGEEEEKPRLSPLHGVILVGVLLSYFSISDAWYRHGVWPVIASGVLFLLFTARERVAPLFGLVLTCISLLVLAYLYSSPSPLFPISAYRSLLATLYPPPSLVMDTGLHLPYAIHVPDTHTHTLLFQMLITILICLFTAFGFSKPGRNLHGLQWIPMVLGIIVAFPLVGHDLFLVLAIPIVIFIFSTENPLTDCYSYPRDFQKFRPFLYGIVVFLLLCLAGYLGYLDWLAILIGRHYSLTQISFPLVGSIPQGTLFFEDYRMGYDWVIPGTIGFGFLLIVAETGLIRTWDDLCFPTGIALFILTLLSTGPSIHSWLVHPLTWIAMACIQNAQRREGEQVSESSQSLKNIPWIPWAFTGVSGLLAIMILWNLYPNWRSENTLWRVGSMSNSIERTVELREALRRTPYRGDVATLYATNSILSFYNNVALPPSPEPEKLEVILSLGAKQGFVPLLGYARLSGLYFLLSQGEQSIDVLQNIVDLAPQEMCLQELLADMQNTLGRKEQALDHYRACANLDPFASRIREKMAQVYASLGRTEEAKAEWTKLQILDPTKRTSIQ